MNDEFWMALALENAAKAIGVSSPNPRVGCVLVKNGIVQGQGFTQIVGQAHAEVMAIRDAQANGADLEGCTVYVTLEPCCHFGRTPPCVNALLTIKPARVVVALLDVNPHVAGQGVMALQAAGVKVDVLDDKSKHAIDAFEINIGFIMRMNEQRVFTRLKWAASADGKTALSDGRSQWITGSQARADGHSFRARADVLVSGVGTVLSDNPQLNVRLEAPLLNAPVKCVIDGLARTPVNARLFEEETAVWLACLKLSAADAEFEAQNQRLNILREAHPHLRVLSFPAVKGKVDLVALWAYFAAQNLNEVHVEAGGVLNGALLASGLVDELLMYVAPRVVGAGLQTTVFNGGFCLDPLVDDGAWYWLEPALVGEDLRLRLRKR